VKVLRWHQIDDELRAEMKASMLSQLRIKLVRVLRLAPRHRDPAIVSKLERAIDAARRLA
jgi:hypothetical protein